TNLLAADRQRLAPAGQMPFRVAYWQKGRAGKAVRRADGQLAWPQLQPIEISQLPLQLHRREVIVISDALPFEATDEQGDMRLAPAGVQQVRQRCGDLVDIGQH